MEPSRQLEQYRRFVLGLPAILDRWQETEGDAQIDLVHELIMALGQRSAVVEECERLRGRKPLGAVAAFTMMLLLTATDLKLLQLADAINVLMDLDVRAAIAPNSVSVTPSATSLDVVEDDDEVIAA
jgi:hypothetical protein